MAPYTKSSSHRARSPSPVAGSGKPTKLDKLLGNFRCIYRNFPELSLGVQHPSLRDGFGQYSTRNSTSKETAEQDALRASTNPRASLPYSILESPPTTLAHPTPKLGRLDKLEKYGLLYRGSNSSKASPPNLNNTSTSEASGELRGHFQDPHLMPSGSARLQRGYGLSVRKEIGRESSSTVVEFESPLDVDDGSANDLVSKATTPATSPDLTLELQARIDAIVHKAETPETDQNIKIIAPAGPWPGANPAHTPQLAPGLYTSGLPSNLIHFQEKARRYRSNISARIATNFAVLRPGERITLPWDKHGDYTIVASPSHQKVGISYGNTSACIIEPHYRVDKVTQLNIIKARLAQIEFERQLKHTNSTAAQSDTPVVVVNPDLVNNSTRPIHVFVDMSNIVIGFYDHMRRERNLLPQQRIHASFFFEALANILERERPCAKRIVAGSMGPGSSWKDHMFEAQSLGYTMHILQRVKGPKPSKVMAQVTPSAPSPNNGGHVHHEQGVDELLQLHMLQSIVDTQTTFSASGELLPPGTMVLATGDAAEAEFSDGFFNHVLRALKHGWCVEVVGFRRNMNQLWDEQAIPAEWRAQFRQISLDDFAEELLASFR